MENIIRPVVHNRFDIEVADAVTGEIKQRITSYNIVLDQYFSRLIGRSSKIGYIHLGTGEGTPAVNRTSMFTFLGAKGNSVVETVKAYPTSYTRRKIVLSPSDYVGARITEVGFGYSTSSGSAVTHSMLKDSEGNQIAIEKTDTDVLTIYATFYLTIGEAVSGVYVLPTPNNNAIISAVLEDSYTTLTLTLGAHNSLVLADDLASNSISNKTNISPTSDLANRKWQVPVTRWNYSEANSHMVSAIGSSTVAAWLLPNTDIFPQIALTDLAVGVGDGVETEFTCPIPKIVPGSESVRVNGVLMTRDVDYTIDNNNNAVEYPELFISTDPQNYVFSGGYNAGYNRYSFFKWNAVNSNPSVGVSNANPIYLDFGSAITINRLIIPTGTFSQNFSSTGSPTTVITFDYSLDGENWSNAFTSQDISGNSINANLWFDPVITARYFRLTSSFSVGYGAGKNPNILFGYITPGLVFMTPPAAGASIEMDCAVDRPIKNENWVLDFSFAVQFERG